MSKVQFTEEQIKLLRENPYTYNITPRSLYLTKEFKALFYKEYQSGKIPREILEEHGYPSDILGDQRIWGITQVIKKQAGRAAGFSEGSLNQALQHRDTVPGGSPEDEIRKLQAEVEYLRQEVEYLKKISSIRDTRK